MLGLLHTIVHGPSWALRRAAAYGLLEIEQVVPAALRTAEHAAEMGRLAARLVEVRWRDKERGDEAKRIEAMARAQGHTPRKEAAEEAAEEPPQRPAAVDGAGADGGEGPDSADM